MKKRFIKKDYKGIHDRFLRDPVFRGRMIENSQNEEVCRAPIICQKKNTCTTRTIGGSLSISREITPNH